MRNLFKTCLVAFVLAGAFTLVGCADAEVQEGIEGAEVDTALIGTDQQQDETAATARLTNAEGRDVGTLTLAPSNDGVQIQGAVSGLAPGPHGFHIHENGECDPDAEDGPFSTAGSHWDPANTENHGGPDDPASERHIGDMGNIEAGDDSTAQIDETFDFLSLEGDTSIVNHAILIHSGEDDLQSNPSGNSGDRVACGVIEEQSPQGGLPPTDAETGTQNGGTTTPGMNEEEM